MESLLTEEILYRRSGGIKRVEAIRSLLKSLGFNQSLLGFRYSIQAIQYLLTINRSPTCSATYELYPIIASLQEPEKTPSAIERAIRHSLEHAYDPKNPRWEDILGTTKGKRPTNKEFLFAAAEDVYYRTL